MKTSSICFWISLWDLFLGILIRNLNMYSIAAIFFVGYLILDKLEAAE